MGSLPPHGTPNEPFHKHPSFGIPKPSSFHIPSLKMFMGKLVGPWGDLVQGTVSKCRTFRTSMATRSYLRCLLFVFVMQTLSNLVGKSRLHEQKIDCKRLGPNVVP